MRKTLALVSLAVTSMIAMAFLVPSALIVRELAVEHARLRAQRQISALAPIVATSTDRSALGRLVAQAASVSGTAIAVAVPGDGDLGRPLAVPSGTLAEVGRSGRAAEAPGGHGSVLLQPVPWQGGGLAVIEVDVRGGAVPRGVLTAWTVMVVIAVALIGCSVLATDRLGERVVGSARRLARAAGRIGVGDGNVRVDLEGPPELQEAAQAFNLMADRIARQFAAERYHAGDLSHRLRTPLTALRLQLDRLGQAEALTPTRLAMVRLEQEIDMLIRAAQRPALDETATCDATEVVGERVRFWSVLAEDQNRAWHLTTVEHPTPVPVNRAELAAAIDALLGNVFQHTLEGTAFAVTLRAGGDRVGVLVSDAGPGITEPATMALRGRSGGGSTGLGLDIVRRLAESTGGDLRIDQSMMGGAQVGVWLRTTGVSPETRRSRRRYRRGSRGPRPAAHAG